MERDADCESKWFTLRRTPYDREMTLEVLHDLEKWSPWKLALSFELINIRFNAPHLTYPGYPPTIIMEI